MIDIYLFLTTKNLQGYNQAKPLKVKINEVRLRKKEELPFKSDTDRWEIRGDSELGPIAWLLNNKSLRALVMGFGRDETKWKGKTIAVYPAQDKGRIIIMAEPLNGKNGS